MPPSEQPGPAAGILARGYAFVVVGLRYLIVVAWAAAVVLAILFLQPRRRPVANAVAVAAPQASRAITTASVALAASFAMLAVIPLEQFRQIAIAMALGVVIDAIAVRSLLVPALVALFGRPGMWPGNRRVPEVAAGPPVTSPARVSSGDQS